MQLTEIPLLPTTVVGSYPQPDWLVDRDKLLSRLPPRIRARDVWRVAEPYLEQAQDDATVIALRDMERAGVDILTDGEIRRESYSNRFATALDGVDLDNPGHRPGRSGRPDIVPRVVGPIRRRQPVEVRDVEFLRASTAGPIKITVPGPFTMTQQAVDDFYADEASLAMDFAVAVNAEILDLVAAGADVIQLDEPYLQARVEAARAYAVRVINRALEGVRVPTVLHTCFGYGLVVQNKRVEGGYPFLSELLETSVDQISIEAAQPNLDLSFLESMGSKTMMVGVLDLGTPVVETQPVVEDRIRAALRHIPAERLVLAPDCGMKYLPRASAFEKLAVMVRAARTVRNEVATQ
ncbi:MAG TPA: 5-methyltetrahydropteroyltriglutamate--homocysteine methyltransferase [Chloroflexota bacterium]|nr:5-methyltetrahydropteroyltriglutamate--homocysteine methyltransferase [Chloroflexota bacterium]